MDEKHANARMHFFEAVRALAASPDSIQTRLIASSECVLQVTIDEFDGSPELKIKFARILDLLATDRDDLIETVLETAAYMTDFDAVKVAHLICDFYSDLQFYSDL